MPEFLINASIWKTSDIVVFVIEQHIPGFFTAAYSKIIESFLFLISSSSFVEHILLETIDVSH